MFTIAAAFGNCHGVYKVGNVQLRPEILGNAQKYIKEKLGCKEDKPVNFVFHGGSGSEKSKIEEALGNGVVKMNIDTDIQVCSLRSARGGAASAMSCCAVLSAHPPSRAFGDSWLGLL